MFRLMGVLFLYNFSFSLFFLLVFFLSFFLSFFSFLLLALIAASCYDPDMNGHVHMTIPTRRSSFDLTHI